MNDFYNPYEELKSIDNSWHMANFHTHCTKMLPDGGYTESMEEYSNTLKAYKSAGYELVMLSGQGTYFDTEAVGKEVGIKTLNGQEHVLLHDGILLVNTRKFLDGSPQEAIDECNQDGGFAILCHPNQNPNLPIEGINLPFTHEQLLALNGAIGVEIFNGCLPRRQYKGVSFGDGLGTDFWDKALSSGKLLWAFANDDSHEAYEIHVGWTEILSKGNSTEDLKTAVHRGSICASRGLRLREFIYEDNILNVYASYLYRDADMLEYRFIKEDGTLINRVYGKNASCPINGDEKYIRVEVLAPDGGMLWTQPLLNRKYFSIQ